MEVFKIIGYEALLGYIGDILTSTLRVPIYTYSSVLAHTMIMQL